MKGSKNLSAQSEASLTECTVTTKELAGNLGVDVKTVQRASAKLFDPSTLMTRVINGGKSQVFNKAQATAIKIELQNHSKVARNGFVTLSISNDLEAWELQKRLDAYKDRRIAELTEENRKKQAVIDRLIDSKGCYSMNQAAKALKLPYGNIKLYERLRNWGILNLDNSPRQDQIKSGHFKVVVKHVSDKVGNKAVTLVTGKGLVYLAKRLNAEIDESVEADS